MYATTVYGKQFGWQDYAYCIGLYILGASVTVIYETDF